MAQGGEKNASSQWENDKVSEKTPPKIPDQEAIVVKNKKQGSLFHAASAQDLRCLDMEREKLDGSSPRGVLEACVREFESEENLIGNSKKSSSTSRALCNWRKFFKLWNKKSIKRLASFPPVGVPKFPRRKSRNGRENQLFCTFYNLKSSVANFTFSELQSATKNFSSENLIGKGGYAEVYKGTLEDGQLIAVKKLTKGTSDEKTAGFLSELGVIAHVNHQNTAKLIGCCVEGGMHLVFKLSPLGSLGSLLHGSRDTKLDWSKRFKIALGVADGLLYLHESCQRRIIHRDIKADNILLTKDYEPQICDFGLAKWLPEQWTHHNVSKFEGTFGYFAPEYFMHGIVDEKTDVYSFGVLLLELITGRQAVDHLQQSLVLSVRNLLDSNDMKELVDPSLGDDYVQEEMDRVILTASMCIEQTPILRPRMSQVVILLRGDECVSQVSEKCQIGTLHRTFSEELSDAQEYNSTKYLSDMNKHKQVAFDF